MSSVPKKIRVAIVVSHPIQHFVHLYKALAKCDVIDLKVFYCSKIGAKPYFDKNMNIEIQWASDLLGGYAHEFLPEADNIKESGFLKINNPSVVAILKDFNPDVVQLHGYAQLTLLRTLVWCKIKHIPVLLWSDSSLLFRRARWKLLIKDMFLPKLLGLFNGVLSTGDNNTAYYSNYGVKPARIFRCPFTVDEALLGQANNEKAKLRVQVRARYEIENNEVVLLFVGKLVSWKRPQDILDALLTAQRKLGSRVKLVAFFAGNGVLLQELKTRAESQHLRAIFAGFINVDVLPTVYAMADVLVFPSEREPYGLSAREAICLGLPLIVSDQIGCVGVNDAARSQQNTLIYQSMNVEALSDSIVSLVNNPEKIRSMATSSLAIALEMGVDCSVAGFVNAVKSVCMKTVNDMGSGISYEHN